ncbi:MAG: BON domain-containing protein [Acidobacteria bacterium]|nr:BON domain-containing protein [Acidobacteriota bacterium]
MSKNRTGACVLVLSLVAIISSVVLAQEAGQSNSASLQGGVSAPGGSTRAATRTDAEIQSCIEGRLAASEKLRQQQFSVSVNSSEATFTGTARNAGSKGAVTRIGQSCGAIKIINNITAPGIPRPTKKVEGRTSL